VKGPSLLRIRQLPPSVVAKIAAGEVIERPASVVKELLENAIDAGATRIEIDLEEGGTELIRVVDNGRGIEPEDLALVFENHATSKLFDAEDLFRIGTMGFRGEALASIGSVAQVKLQSRAVGREIGAEISCDGGQVSECRTWNGSSGTRVEVRHLFFSTPVRRKFLKTIPTEVGHVTETITRIALARPDIQLVLRHNGKMVVEVPETAGLLDRIRLFFGAEVANACYAVNSGAALPRLTGFVADPSCDRGHPRHQYLFVNGRWFRDRSLGHAFQEAYRGLLLTGRYAVGFLFLELPADQVDVNVHPTKMEVRFREANAIYHLVLAAVKDRLRLAQLTPRLVAPPEGPREIGPTPTAAISEPSPSSGAYSAGRPMNEDTLFTSEFKNGRAIQLHNAYLVVESKDGMLVIDQHALHERILFEQLRGRIAAGQLEKQRLLIPEPLDLSPEQAARVLESKTDLAELGMEVDDFGGGTILLASVPAMLGRAIPSALFRDVADRLTSKDRPPTRDQLFEHLLATMACRAAVKAGDRLTPEEIDDLVAQRDLAENSHHCPHGRPTSLVFTRKELDKQFRRI